MVCVEQADNKKISGLLKDDLPAAQRYTECTMYPRQFINANKIVEIPCIFVFDNDIIACDNVT